MDDIDIALEVDGKKIPMNEFVKKIICGIITGSVGALRGIDEDWRNISISLKR